MSDEIAEFLRRAAQRRAEQMQQQAEQQRRAVQQQQQQQYVPPPAPLRPTPVIVEAEIVDDDELTPVRSPLSRVSQSVASHFDTRGFDRRADEMADATEQADERMAAHLHQSFDHSLGALDRGSQAIMAAITPEADNEVRARVAASHPLLSMLRDPQSVRNAIILSELLDRPVKNW